MVVINQISLVVNKILMAVNNQINGDSQVNKVNKVTKVSKVAINGKESSNLNS